MTDTNGNPNRLDEIRTLLRQIDERRDEMDRKHADRLREIRRSEVISLLIVGLGGAMMLLAAILQCVARFWP